MLDLIAENPVLRLLLLALLFASVAVVAYFVAQVVDPHLSKRIAAGELASAIWLGLVSVAFGVLSAASMTS